MSFLFELLFQCDVFIFQNHMHTFLHKNILIKQRWRKTKCVEDVDNISQIYQTGIFHLPLINAMRLIQYTEFIDMW